MSITGSTHLDVCHVELRLSQPDKSTTWQLSDVYGPDRWLVGMNLSTTACVKPQSKLSEIKGTHCVFARLTTSCIRWKIKSKDQFKTCWQHLSSTLHLKTLRKLEWELPAALKTYWWKNDRWYVNSFISSFSSSRNIKPRELGQEVSVLHQRQTVSHQHRGEPGPGEAAVSEAEVRRLGQSDNGQDDHQERRQDWWEPSSVEGHDLLWMCTSGSGCWFEGILSLVLEINETQK